MKLLRREPVRVYCYTVALAVIGLLAAYGVIAENLIPVWLGLASAALAVGGAESARARVTPVKPRTGAVDAVYVETRTDPSSRPRRRARRAAGGYSAVELLVIVILVLIAVALALWLAGGRPG